MFTVSMKYRLKNYKKVIFRPTKIKMGGGVFALILGGSKAYEALLVCFICRFSFKKKFGVNIY